MSSRKARQGRPVEAGGRRARWMALVAAGLVVLAGGALWLWLAPREASGGAPRLVVERTDVDLGYRQFDTPARVVFTLGNAGDAPLRLSEVPRVKVAAGC